MRSACAGCWCRQLRTRDSHRSSPSGVRYRQISTNRASGAAAFLTAYGHGVGGSNQSVTYQRYLAKYGAKREEMWGYIGTAHRNGQDSPPSVWKGRLINEEDYLNARLIAYPMKHLRQRYAV